MESKTLYQTLEDRSNPEEVLKNAPFPCRRQNAWLGEGYYFWDHFIENAHWWGNVGYKGKYIITKITCSFDLTKCYDLVGSTNHLDDFGKSVKLLKDLGYIKETTTVARILMFMKEHLDFDYEAIRVYGINSISEKKRTNTPFIYRMKFEENGYSYLDYKPEIQICVFEKTGLSLRDLIIEYPDRYKYNQQN